MPSQNHRDIFQIFGNFVRTQYNNMWEGLNMIDALLPGSVSQHPLYDMRLKELRRILRKVSYPSSKMNHLTKDRLELLELVRTEMNWFIIYKVLPMLLLVLLAVYITYKSYHYFKTQATRYQSYNISYLLGSFLSSCLSLLQLLISLGAILSWIPYCRQNPTSFPMIIITSTLTPVYALIADTITRGMGTSLLIDFVTGSGSGMNFLPLVVGYGVRRVQTSLTERLFYLEHDFGTQRRYAQEDQQEDDECELRPVQLRDRIPKKKSKKSKKSKYNRICERCTLKNKRGSEFCEACDYSLRKEKKEANPSLSEQDEFDELFDENECDDYDEAYVGSERDAGYGYQEDYEEGYGGTEEYDHEGYQRTESEIRQRRSATRATVTRNAYYRDQDVRSGAT